MAKKLNFGGGFWLIRKGGLEFDERQESLRGGEAVDGSHFCLGENRDVSFLLS